MSLNEPSNSSHNSLLNKIAMNLYMDEMKERFELMDKLKESSVGKFNHVLSLMEEAQGLSREVVNDLKEKSESLLSIEGVKKSVKVTTIEAVAVGASQASIEAQSSQAPAEIKAQIEEADNCAAENSTEQAEASALEEESDDGGSQNLSKRGKFIMLRVTCPERNCGDQFASMRQLEQHQYKKHKIQAFPCAQHECKDSFQTKAQLVVHKEQKHRRVSVWQCKMCKRKFENTKKCPDRFEGLFKHYKENHYLGEYKCIRCDTVSESQAKANRHYNVKCLAKIDKANKLAVQPYNPGQQQQQQQQQQDAQYPPFNAPNGLFPRQVNYKISTTTTVNDYFSVRPRNAPRQQPQTNQPQFPAEMPPQYHCTEPANKSATPVYSNASAFNFVKVLSKSANKPTAPLSSKQK